MGNRCGKVYSGGKAARQANEQLARARAEHSAHMLTIFMPNTILLNPHRAWDATYSNDVVRDWLFQQSRPRNALSGAKHP